MPKYLNPYTDFGFKKLFGEENNKDLLQDFLNQLLPTQHQIAELNFQNTEQLPDIGGELFFDKLHFKFLQMPLFTKQEHELETRFDKWLYFLKHLESFDHIPAVLNEPIFKKANEGIAEGLENGITAGEIKGLHKTSIAMLQEGLDIVLIKKVTDLSAECLLQLKNVK